MPDTAATIMTHSPQVDQLIVVAVSFLFTALTGIIIWLAKGLNKKSDDNSEGIRVLTLNVSNMSKDISSLIRDVGAFRESLKELEVLKMKILLLEQEVNSQKIEIQTIRNIQETRDITITDLRLAIVKYERKLFFDDKEKNKD